jgi:pimeloyl-ACP methyl ester carboxylesterase
MSTGGFVGMRIALRRPDLLKSLLLMDTSAESESEEAGKKYSLLLKVVKLFGLRIVKGQIMPILFHKTFLKDKTRKDEVKQWEKIMTSHNKNAIILFGKGIFSRSSVLGKLKGLSIPTAVVVGEFDKATPLEYEKRLAAAIPNAKLYTIPDSGHSAAIEKPNLVAEAMQDFYKSVGII